MHLVFLIAFLTLNVFSQTKCDDGIDQVFSTFAQKKLTAECIGPDNMLELLRKSELYKEDCKQLRSENGSIYGFDDTENQKWKLQNQRKYNAPTEDFILFNEDKVRSLKTKITNRLSNYTCLLRKFGIFDNENNIDVIRMRSMVKDLALKDKPLSKELTEGVQWCKRISDFKLVKSLPTNMPQKLKRATLFMECYRKAVKTACLKFNLRKFKVQIDLNGLDNELFYLSEDDQMLSILWADVKLRENDPNDIIF